MIFKYLKLFSKKFREKIIINNYKNLSTKEIFEKIYRDKVWNKKSKNMNSGPGSHNHLLINPYIEFVLKFLKKEKDISVLDLGCGDFNIGKKIYDQTSSYTGIDIVQPLIDHNKKVFKDKKLNFLCLDIIENELPKADCIIIRQVLQHLDNKSVSKILKKIVNYKFIIITEHISSGGFKPNIDKPTGPLIRADFRSGLDIEKSPFNFNFKEKKEISIIDNELGGLHKTIIYTVF